MIHFRDRHDVINWAMAHIPKPYRTIARSFKEGQVEFLGGFKNIPCAGRNIPCFVSGWIIKIISKNNKVFYVLIYPDIAGQSNLAVINIADWRCWDGDKSDNPLYQGDFPERYKELKDEAIKKQTK